MADVRLTEPELDALADKLAARVLDRVGSPWLDAKGAADYLSCSLSRVRKLTMLGHLPSHRDGVRVLYRRDDLDRFVRSGGASTPGP